MRSLHTCLPAFAIVALLASGCASPRPSPHAAIDRIARETLARGPVQGMAICVLRQGQVAYEGAWGYMDTLRAEAVTRETMFDIASVSKPFTATLALQEVAAGRLSLDAPLGVLLDRVPEAYSGITLRHLLSQTSGVPEFMEDGDPVALKFGRPLGGEWILGWLETKTPNFPPGERWEYSNTNFKLVGAIAERSAGRPFQDLFHERIVGATGLSRLGLTAYGPHAGRPRIYQVVDGRPRQFAYAADTPVMHDGGVTASASHLARAFEAIFDGTLLPDSLAALARTPSATSYGPVGYGLGLRLGQLGGHPKFGHTGGIEGFWACAAHYPEDSLTIVVLLNTDGVGGAGAVGAEVAVARTMLGIDEDSLDEVALGDAQRAAMCGTFEERDEGKALRYEVYEENAQLMDRDLQSGETSPLRHFGDGVFGHPDWGATRLVANPEEPPVRVLTVTTGGFFYGVAYRVTPLP